MPDHKHFRIEMVDDATVITLIDPKLFDTLLVTELQDEMIEYVETEKPSKVVVDFSQVTHCSTAVINGLLRTKKRIVAEGGKLNLCGMADPIREAYRMLNLDGTVFEIHDNLESATGSL